MSTSLPLLSLFVSLSSPDPNLGVQERKHSDLERKMSKKYHMVKFFERKNIKKGIRQVERKMQEVSSFPPRCICIIP